MKWQLFLLAFATLMGSAMLENSTNPADRSLFGPVFGIAANASNNLLHWLEDVASGGEHAANSYWNDFLKLPSFRQRMVLGNLSETDFQKAVEQAEHILKDLQQSRGSVERSLEETGNGLDNIDHSDQKRQAPMIPGATGLDKVAEFLKSLNRIKNVKIGVDIQRDTQCKK